MPVTVTFLYVGLEPALGSEPWLLKEAACSVLASGVLPSQWNLLLLKACWMAVPSRSLSTGRPLLSMREIWMRSVP